MAAAQQPQRRRPRVCLQEGIPTEIVQHIVDYLHYPDKLALDEALVVDGKPVELHKKLDLNWKALALQHAENLLGSGALRMHINYNDNHRQQIDPIDGRGLRPSASSRLPRKYTYPQMMRFKSYRPALDLNNRPVTIDDIQRCFKKDLRDFRFRIIFETRVQREGGGYPSQESRQKIGMEIEDARNYAQLIKDTESGPRRDFVKERQKEDNLAREMKVGQNEAFRAFFYNLVFDQDFQPEVCMHCFAFGAVWWQRKGCRRLRLCEPCLIDANGINTTWITDRELKQYGIFLPMEYDPDHRWFDSVPFPGSCTYLSARGADRLCKAYTGATFNSLEEAKRTGTFTDDESKMYALVAGIADHVAVYGRRQPWASLDVGIQTPKFWVKVIVWAKKKLAEIPLNELPPLHASYALVSELATSLWRVILWDMHQRAEVSQVREELFIERELTIHHLEDHAVFGNPALNSQTISMGELKRLSYRIHGKAASDLVGDAQEDKLARLGRYRIDSFILLHIMDRYHRVFFEVMVDLTALVDMNMYNIGNFNAGRELRVRSFLDKFYNGMRAIPVTTTELLDNLHWMIVMDPRLVSRIDMFLEMTKTSLAPAALEWSANKQVAVQLPLGDPRLHGADAPEYFVLWALGCGATVVPDNTAPTGYAHSCGRIHWNTIYSSLLDTPMVEGF